MNIIEAIKSGRKYRLHGTEGWFYPPNEHLQNSIFFSVQHILADDWEVEQKPVTITKEQFDKACQSVLGKFASNHILVVCWLGLTKSERTITEVLANLAKELGL